jgi:hypothetical protein
MRIVRVVSIFAICLLLCAFQQQTSVNEKTSQGKSANKGTPVSAAPSTKPTPEETDKKATAASSAHQNDKVEVTALPSEIAVKQIKDSIDRTILICTIILTIVGVAGTAIAVWTLFVIKKQAEIMEEHKTKFDDLAKAANSNAEAAIFQARTMKEQMDLTIEKERAKLRIELEPFQPLRTEDQWDSYMVNGSVSIYGSTEAFIEKTEIYASIGEEGIDHPLPEWLFGMHLPPVIRAGTPAVKISALVNGKDGPASDEEITPVREAKAFVYCIAKIEFVTLGQKWVVRLRQYFKPIWGTDDTGAEFLGSWETNGMVWENEECRQKSHASNISI